MIIDTISNSEKYNSLHPSFAKAFEYIRSQNFLQTEDGKFEVDGDNIRAILSNKMGLTTAESAAKFECHDKHIDIQFCVKGNEQMGWRPRSTCMVPKGEYNPEKDVLFFSDAPDMFFRLTDNQFAIFFPEDVHAAGIGEEEIKKLVIKVKI
jgi:YhcH/YjgK/YiaL family protein